MSTAYATQSICEQVEEKSRTTSIPVLKRSGGRCLTQNIYDLFEENENDCEYFCYAENRESAFPLKNSFKIKEIYLRDNNK
jgi:hypothetical protein